MPLTDLMRCSANRLNERFEYCDESRWNDRWDVMRGENALLGDCDDYAITLAYYLTGRTWLGLLRAIWRRDVEFWYCFTSDGEPHMLLKHNDMWIDNIYREWVHAPPHELRFRAPFPLVVAKMIGTRWILAVLAFAWAGLMAKLLFQ